MQNNVRTKALADRTEAEQRASAFKIEAARKMPAWAKAVIVAELIEDDSDSQSDYFGSKTRRTVIIGFSKHTRDLFPELRKAALNFADTADMFDAPESAEHREKYSMGGGFYLKAGYRHSSGWRVSKSTLYQGANSIPVGEWAIEAPADKPVVAVDVPHGAAFGIQQHTHTKHGFDMWVVILADRVEREDYERLLSAAKAVGGWYSRAWGKSPAGFAFKAQDVAQAFAIANLTQGSEPTSETAAPLANVQPGGLSVAAKLVNMADRLQSEIDDKFRERQSNTPKRQREAQSARLDGYRLQRTQQAMRALAAHHVAGTVSPDLRGVVTKAAIFDLARGEITSRGGYYDAGHETGKPAVDTAATRALWSLLNDRSAEDVKADQLRDKVQSLQFANIPGYFPTPASIIRQMIDAADIRPGMSILEPSAGSGAILDQIADTGCKVIVFERHASLREVLTLKGYTLASTDFMDSEWFTADRVLMNPPFEHAQDIHHVRRAFGHLTPGGRLVAVMSPGPFYRQDALATEFRAWFDALGGEKTDIPAGAFKESGTGVATVLVVLDK